ncbi:MAG: homing endonuclease associated repeat-containing protein [Halobacteriales archaeon]
MSESELTDAALLEELKSLGERLGRTPTRAAMDGQGAYDPIVYIERFGSWEAAVERAGFDPEDLNRHRYASITDESLAKKLRQLVNSSEAKDGRFRADLLAELRRLANDLGETPTIAQMEEYGEYSSSPYIKHFGSWNEAVSEAGLDPNPGYHPISDAKLLDELDRLADELEQPPTVTAMQQYGKYSAKVYIDRFGSWGTACELAGVTKSDGDSESPIPIEESQTTLVLAPTFSEAAQTTGWQLLPPYSPSMKVLAVTYGRTADEWFREWRDRAGAFPSHVHLIRLDDVPAEDADTAPRSSDAIDEFSVTSTHPSDLTALGMNMRAKLDEWAGEDGPIVIKFDSLTPLFERVDMAMARRFARLLITQVHDANAIAYVYLDPTAHDRSTVEEFIQLFESVVEIDEAGDITIRTRRT